jgi:hypothetical protein
MDLGYRNRFKLGKALDLLIDRNLKRQKNQKCYSNKDLADLIHLAHKMRMDEIKPRQK